MSRRRAASSFVLVPLLVSGLIVGSVKQSHANPVVGLVAGAAIVYVVLGSTGERMYDAQHARIDFSLSQVDDEMARLESDCDSARHARSHAALYDRLDELRSQLQSDPQNEAFLGELDSLRALPRGEEAYYVALMEKAYDYVGYPFAGNRYYVKRASVQEKNPCALPTFASLEEAPAAPSGPTVTSLMP